MCPPKGLWQADLLKCRLFHWSQIWRLGNQNARGSESSPSAEVLCLDLKLVKGMTELTEKQLQKFPKDLTEIQRPICGIKMLISLAQSGGRVNSIFRGWF